MAMIKKIKRSYPKGYVDKEDVLDALQRNVEIDKDCEYGDYGQVLSEWYTCDWGEVLNTIEMLPTEGMIPKSVLEDIKRELHATAEMHTDGDYYLRDAWIDEIIDKYINGKDK